MSRTFRHSSSKRAALSAAAAAALFGCRGILGVDGYGTLPFSPDASSGSCESCMVSLCSDEEAACAREPACAALETHLSMCAVDDDACRVTWNLSIRRTTEMSRVIECAARSCDQCAAAHATFGGLECTRCLEKKAPDSLKALSTSFAALELEACQQDCSPKFEDQCPCTDLDGVGSADGGVEALALLDSLRGGLTCSQECTGTADWSCLGHLQSIPLAAHPPPFRLHVRLATYLDTVTHEKPKPLVGARVSACTGAAVCTAMSPRTDITQDGTGRADLTLEPLQVGAYFGDLTVQWNEESTGPGSMALLYYFPPLRRTPSWTWRRVVSRADAKGLVANYDPSIALDWDNYGGIIWSVAACNGLPAEGVTAILDGPEQIVYVTETHALSKDLQQTSNVGLGAVLSVAPGERTMELRTPEGATIGKYEFQVAAGAITTLSFAPSVIKLKP